MVSFRTINGCRNKMYLLCKLRSINLEITRETKVVDPPVHLVDSLFADYNFCVAILNGSCDIFLIYINCSYDNFLRVQPSGLCDVL